MLYLFQTIVYAAICCLFYLLFLKDRPMHRFNRRYLLICAALPFLLPFVRLQFLSTQESPVNQYMNMRMPEIVVTDATVNDSMNSALLFLGMGYVVISVIILTVNAYKWWCLRGIIRKAEKQEMPGYTLLPYTGYGPGSWNRYIFLPEAVADERIIAHEAAHVRLKHTRDITFLTALQCLFWYNPFLHFIKKEIRQVHEFEADAAVQGDTAEYQELLLHHFLKQCRLPFTHSFINHPIKRRIMMLDKNSSVKNYKWSIALSTAAFLFFAGNIIWFQSCQSKKWEVKEESKTDSLNITPDYGSMMVGEIADTSYVRIAFNEMGNMTKKLFDELVYPENAKKNHIEGQVQLRFMIDKTGRVKKASILKSDNNELSDAALEALYKASPFDLPPTKDGNKYDVWFILPVNFKLNNDPAKTQVSNNKAKAIYTPNLSDSAQKTSHSDFIAIAEKMLEDVKKGSTTLKGDALKELISGMESFLDKLKDETGNTTFINQGRNWICVDEISKAEYDKLITEIPAPKKIYFSHMPHIPAKIK